MKTVGEKLGKALEGLGYVEVLQSSSDVEGEEVIKGGRVAYQLRVDSESMTEWLSVVDFLLQEEGDQEEDEDQWSLHICKTFLRNEDRLGFVWTVSLNSKTDIRGCLKDVSRALRTVALSAKSSTSSPTVTTGHRIGTRAVVQQATEAIVSRSVANQDRSPIVHVAGGKAHVDEMPLIGVTEDRNRPTSGGKGARFIRSGV